MPQEMSLDSASLLGLREEAYRANSRYAANSSLARVVAWRVDQTGSRNKHFYALFDRTDVVLRLQHLVRRQICTTELDVRHLVNEEMPDEDRETITNIDPYACAGVYTTYRANPAMNRLVVSHGLLAYDRYSNRGTRMNHLFGMRYGQPDEKPVNTGERQIHTQLETPMQRMTKLVRKMRADRYVEHLDVGKTSNLLVPTPEEVAAF